jgi:hypothetical protein
MERRRAIAWAGSIAMIGCISAFTLGSLVGGFGLGLSPAPETRVDGPRLIPEDTRPGPTPERIPSESTPEASPPAPTTEATERGPTPKSPATAGAEPRSSAGRGSFKANLPPSPFVPTADLDDESGPQVDLEVPCAPVIATTASTSHATEMPSDSVAPSYSRAGDPPERASERFVRRKRSSTPSQMDTAQLGSSKAAADKPGTGHRALDGAGGRGG